MPDIELMGATYPDVPAVTLPSGATTATFYYPDEIDYASSPSSGGNANRANAILYGTVDSTSTATVFTATVEGLTALVDGTTVMLHNGVVTSASGFTVNVNGLGAKKCYNNMTNATQDTTIFNASYTMLFVYSTSLDSGNGGWWIYRGYDGNTNTIGYQLRSNSSNLVASDTGYRYRLWLTSADGSKWVPINTSTSTNATTARTLNTRPIDPFGPIVYRSTNGTCTAGTGIGATAIWQQYTLAIGYSYMASRFSLTAQDSVYLRCTPQTDGSAVMQDIVQTLPTSKDGKIYIHLGTAYSTTNMELTIEHPVYWHDGTGIRLWTGAESGGGPEPSSTTPAMDGTAAVGTATTYARADHVHPTDTSRQATLVSGTNIKTINNQSLLGSDNLTVRELPDPRQYDNGCILMIVNGYWTPVLPKATDTSYGMVMVDGTSITATNGVISVASSVETYEVTITLTNPLSSDSFNRFTIHQSDSSDYNPAQEEQIGSITSPTGSATVTVSMPYLRLFYDGTSVSLGTVTCTGGVSLVTTYDGVIEVYQVTGDGTIVSDGVDYND